MKDIYYKNKKIQEEDIYELSEEHKIPNDVMIKIIKQMQTKGIVDRSDYSGPLAGRVSMFIDELSFMPKPEASAGVTPEAEEEKPKATKAKKEKPAPQKQEEKEKEEQEAHTERVQKASIQLIQAMVNTEEGNFFIDEQGVCKINQSNPPTLEASYKVMMNVVKLGKLAERMDSSQGWMLGSLVCELQELHGETFEISQVINANTRSYNTVMTAASVYRAFKDKRYPNLTFTHHKEAWHIKAPEDVKHLILKKAEKVGLSSDQVRRLGTFYKDFGDAETIKNIKTREQAEDLIKANDDSRAKFYVYNEGEWILKTADKMAPPTGRIVINIKTNKVQVDNGPWEEIKKVGKRG
jgi:hypothetical protein